MVHEIFLDQYRAKCKQIGPLVLGTEGSYGNETLKIETSSFWDGLTITAIFNVDTPVKILVSDGVVSVPQEATAKAGKFTVAFLGVANGIRRISEDFEYIVLPHSDIDAQDPTQPTPSVWEQFVQDVKSAATTFVPSVSQDGVISWTNNGNQPNPEPVYIGGKKGDKGDAPNIQIGTVTTLEPDEQATVERTGTDENPIFNFGIPKGEKGEAGQGEIVKKWELIGTVEGDGETGIFEFTNLDLTEFAFVCTGLTNTNESIGSAITVSINGNDVARLDTQKSSGASQTRYQFCHIKYNGLYWEQEKMSPSINESSYYDVYGTVYAPYSYKLNIGVCNRLKLYKGYMLKSGTIKIYGR